MNEKPIIDVEFAVVENPENLPGIPQREPILKRGWWKGLFLFVLIFGGLTLARLHQQGDWPFH